MPPGRLQIAAAFSDESQLEGVSEPLRAQTVAFVQSLQRDTPAALAEAGAQLSPDAAEVIRLIIG